MWRRAAWAALIVSMIVPRPASSIGWPINITKEHQLIAGQVPHCSLEIERVCRRFPGDSHDNANLMMAFRVGREGVIDASDDRECESIRIELSLMQYLNDIFAIGVRPRSEGASSGWVHIIRKNCSYAGPDGLMARRVAPLFLNNPGIRIKVRFYIRAWHEQKIEGDVVSYGVPKVFRPEFERNIGAAIVKSQASNTNMHICNPHPSTLSGDQSSLCGVRLSFNQIGRAHV